MAHEVKKLQGKKHGRVSRLVSSVKHTYGGLTKPDGKYMVVTTARTVVLAILASGLIALVDIGFTKLLSFVL